MYLHFRCYLRQRNLSETHMNVPGDFRPSTQQRFQLWPKEALIMSLPHKAHEAQPSKGHSVGQYDHTPVTAHRVAGGGEEVNIKGPYHPQFKASTALRGFQQFLTFLQCVFITLALHLVVVLRF